MSSAIKRGELAAVELELRLPEKIINLWPVIMPMAAAVVFILARLYGGPRGFLSEGSLTMLALIAYLSAAVLLVTNLFVKERVLTRLGIITVAMGVCFNFSGWMIRWIEAGDKEGWKQGINGIWRYFPLDNLYPLTLGFCFGAAITTLVIIRKPKYEFLGALAMPIVTVILTLGMLLGNDISTLPPILDSYWRPIHVSVATIGYGVCLVSFGLAFAYLLKDGVRSESIAIAVALFGLLDVRDRGPLRDTVPRRVRRVFVCREIVASRPSHSAMGWPVDGAYYAGHRGFARVVSRSISFKRDDKARKLGVENLSRRGCFAGRSPGGALLPDEQHRQCSLAHTSARICGIRPVACGAE